MTLSPLQPPPLPPSEIQQTLPLRAALKAFFLGTILIFHGYGM